MDCRKVPSQGKAAGGPRGGGRKKHDEKWESRYELVKESILKNESEAEISYLKSIPFTAQSELYLLIMVLSVMFSLTLTE